MQGCDLLIHVPVDHSEQPVTPTFVETHENEIETCTWTLHTPPLRYEVASLQHWLDLNA